MSSTPKGRIAGLDALRFVLAVVVVVNHLGPPQWLEDRTSLPLAWDLARVAVINSFNGPAAVAIFFVLSGVCIHFPFRGNRSLPSVGRFYARRNVRILLPAAAAALLSPLVGVRLDRLTQSILWSLVCEEIYYLIYPALRACASRIGWLMLFGGSVIAALLVMRSDPSARYMSDFGLKLTWIIGLPYWLAGCLIAEKWDRDGLPTSPTLAGLWIRRGFIAAVASVASIAHFHLAIGLIWTLPLVCVLAVFWIPSEVGWARVDGRATLDAWGAFSYSIYLVHPFALALLARVREAMSVSQWPWVVRLICTLGICWVFSLAVERPSHRLARRISHALSSREVGSSPLVESSAAK